VWIIIGPQSAAKLALKVVEGTRVERLGDANPRAFATYIIKFGFASDYNNREWEMCKGHSMVHWLTVLLLSFVTSLSGKPISGIFLCNTIQWNPLFNFIICIRSYIFNLSILLKIKYMGRSCVKKETVSRRNVEEMVFQLHFSNYK
jgi:hypothetical protein